MKRDAAQKLTEQALSELTAALEAGRSETLQEYLSMLSRFHRYSFANVMLIYRQFPEATHVAGYTAWQKLGRQVKKGEKGIAILAPLVKQVPVDEETDEADSGSTVPVVRGFKVVHVFDVSQTEGDPLPEPARISGDPAERLAQLRQLLAEEGIALEYAPLPPGVQGQSAGGKITIQPDLTPAEDFAVLVHEASHELLHRQAREQRPSETVRETEAEAVAFVVSQAIGLDCSTRSSDYIQLYAGNAETLAESLEHIQRAATTILTALEVEPSPERLP